MIEGEEAVVGVQQLLWLGWLGASSASPCVDGTRMGVPQLLKAPSRYKHTYTLHIWKRRRLQRHKSNWGWGGRWSVAGPTR